MVAWVFLFASIAIASFVAVAIARGRLRVEGVKIKAAVVLGGIAAWFLIAGIGFVTWLHLLYRCY